jgi:hypothetical protein
MIKFDGAKFKLLANKQHRDSQELEDFYEMIEFLLRNSAFLQTISDLHRSERIEVSRVLK